MIYFDIIILKLNASDKMQFGFMPGSGTTNAIFIFRQLQQKYLAKKIAFVILAFVDLKKFID